MEISADTLNVVKPPKTKVVLTHRTALIATTALLTFIGLLAIYASSSIPASQRVDNEFLYIQKQMFVTSIGFLAIFALGHVSFSWIERATLPFLVLTLALLTAVHIPGFAGHAKGASRWILIYGFTIQPGELAKICLVMFLAKNLGRPSSQIQNFWRGLAPNLVVLALLMSLLLIQPDFGTVVLLGIIALSMFFVAGMRAQHIWLFGLTALVGGFIAIFSASYRTHRLMTFLDPWRQIRSGGFQIIQSFLGFQNGGLLGLGLGESRQKLYFLPEAHTDFILSVIGEELGLPGVLLICALFLYFTYLGLQICRREQIPYRKFLAFGLTCHIAIQATINMGVTMGLLPTKGITLPFVSNGSNSLFVSLLSVAILARISMEDGSAARKPI